MLRCLFRRLVILAELVRQSGIRIGADPGIGDARQFGDIGAQLVGAERTVEADRKQAGMADRVPERLGRLTAQGPARPVGDGTRDDHRQAEPDFLEQHIEREQRRLGIERVEHGFDQDHVDAALDEAARRLAIGVAHLVEAGRPEARIVDVRRERTGAVGGPDRPGDETHPRRVRRHHLPGRLAGDLGAAAVEFEDRILSAVVGLRDRRRAEGVGRDDVGARLVVADMDVADRVGLGQDQQVVVPLEVVRMRRETRAAEIRLGKPQCLYFRAHRAVEHEDALLDGGAQGFLPLQVILVHAVFLTGSPAPSAGRRPRRRQIA